MENFKEEWRPIVGYEGLYEVSNTGKIKRCEYVDANNRLCKSKILKFKINKGGYCTIGLTKNGKRSFLMGHRLVAMAFIPNPDNLPQINHKDENRQNNYVSNLEWCTSKYNINYGNSVKKRSFGVIQLTKEGKFVREYRSGFAASQANNIARTNLYNALHGNTDSAGGFLWKYVDNERARKAEERRQKRSNYTAGMVIQYSIDGKQLNVFKNITEAAAFFNISSVAIRKNCTEETKICQGYIFRYQEKSETNIPAEKKKRF